MTRAEVRARLDAERAAIDAPAKREARMRREIEYRYRRQLYLPKQIEATRVKLAHLEAEAARLGVVA